MKHIKPQTLQDTAVLQFGAVVNVYNNTVDMEDQIIVQVEGYIKDGCTLLNKKAKLP